MQPTLNDKLIAYLVLFSGLAISGVAEYYSIMGLIAIYPAALWPIVIMGIVLGLGKITGTVWLKQNWDHAPQFLKLYILPAVIILMLITSLGVFGFLSKAHSDQSLVSGDVQSKIAVYDEKIKTAKENIDANRKALKQMDEAVDQVMGRSQDEKGADKAVAIRRGQQKERARLQAEITSEQKTISQLSEERAPIAAEVRKVEAEVGPIKYIAHLLYGENPDANILEKAVIWVTVLIVIVLDPMAVVLLLASQYSFQRFREQEAEQAPQEKTPESKEPVQEVVEVIPEQPIYEPDDGSLSDEQIDQIQKLAEEEFRKPIKIVDMPEHAYLQKPWVWKVPGVEPVGPQVYKPEAELPVVEEKRQYQIMPELIKEKELPVAPFDLSSIPAGEYVVIDGQRMDIKSARQQYVSPPPEQDKEPLTEVIEPEIKFDSYIQNEEQQESGQWKHIISEAEYRDLAQTKLKNDTKNNPNNPA